MSVKDGTGDSIGDPDVAKHPGGDGSKLKNRTFRSVFENTGTGRSVVSVMDITDLVRSKEALERSEQRLTALTGC